MHIWEMLIFALMRWCGNGFTKCRKADYAQCSWIFFKLCSEVF